MNLNELSAATLKKLLLTREVSNCEIMAAVLDRIDAADESIGAFLTVRDRNELIQEARKVDERRSRGEFVGALAGLPVAIKDNISTEGIRTTCASKMLNSYVPPYDATVVAKIRKADGIILGKTNLDEFAMGSSTENSAFKITRNPHNLDYVPGGTSGGSAAAVAANETILAIGSDTGGSIRQPASFCGVVGLKPTYGRVSRYGLIAYGSSLDQIGTLTKTPSDARLLFSVISGHDPMDTTSLPQKFDDETLRTSGSLRIGVPKEYFIEGVDPEVLACGQDLLTTLRGLGHEIVEISLPHTSYAVPTYYIIAAAEMSSNLARYDGCRYGYRASQYGNMRDMLTKTRTQGFGSEVKRRILLGTFVLSAGYYDAYYEKAMKVRTLIYGDFEDAFRRCDTIMTPVAPTPAFKIGEKTSDPLAMYLVDIFSVTANLTGLPGISLPFGFSNNGLPLSMQFIAPRCREDLLLKLSSDIWNTNAEHAKWTQ